MDRISSKVVTAEVIDTSNAYKYTEIGDPPVPVAYGTITVRMIEGIGHRAYNIYAIPLDPHTVQIPKVGEMVLLTRSVQKTSMLHDPSDVFYYTHTVNIQDLLPENKLDGFSFVDARPNDSINGAMKKEDAEEKSEAPVIPKLQPYEGDKLVYSRFGSLIRFSSNNTKDKNYKSERPERDLEIKYAQKTPPWKGSADNSPIMMITNGYDITKPVTEYSIEDPEKDQSYIYLTSDQTIKIDSSQKNLGLGVQPSNTYNKPQVILSSDRVLINAKEEQVILSGNDSVTIATPNWAMDMNDFFNAFQDLVTEIEKTATAQSPYGTGVGPTTPNPGLTAGIAKIKAVLSTMKQ